MASVCSRNCQATRLSFRCQLTACSVHPKFGRDQVGAPLVQAIYGVAPSDRHGREDAIQVPMLVQSDQAILRRPLAGEEKRLNLILAQKPVGIDGLDHCPISRGQLHRRRMGDALMSGEPRGLSADSGTGHDLSLHRGMPSGNGQSPADWQASRHGLRSKCSGPPPRNAERAVPLAGVRKGVKGESGARSASGDSPTAPFSEPTGRAVAEPDAVG